MRNYLNSCIDWLAQWIILEAFNRAAERTTGLKVGAEMPTLPSLPQPKLPLVGLLSWDAAESAE